MKAFGTDGELALPNAFENAFPNAMHLRCFKNFRDNIQSKFMSLNLEALSSEEILGDKLIPNRPS